MASYRRSIQCPQFVRDFAQRLPQFIAALVLPGGIELIGLVLALPAAPVLGLESLSANRVCLFRRHARLIEKLSKAC